MHGFPKNRDDVTDKARIERRLVAGAYETIESFMRLSKVHRTRRRVPYNLPTLSLPVSVHDDGAVKITFERSAVLTKGGEKASRISSKDSF